MRTPGLLQKEINDLWLLLTRLRSGSSSPLVPASLVGNIYIDPQNSTGNASPAGPGTITSPFLKYQNIAEVWGTTSPLLNTSTTLNFLSSHTDNTDPVVWTPICNNQALATIKAPNAPATAAVFTLNTAKNRAAGSNSLLSGSF